MCPMCFGLSFVKEEISWAVVAPNKAAKSEIRRCTVCGFLFHRLIEPKEFRTLTQEERDRLKLIKMKMKGELPEGGDCHFLL